LGEDLEKGKGIAHLVWFVLFVLCITACGSPAAKVTVEGSTIKSNGDNKSVTIETKDENGKKTVAAISGSKDIPEEFPKDVPIPHGAKVTGSVKNAVGENQSIIVTYTVDMKIEDLHKLYADYLKDKEYSDQMDMSTEGMVFISGNLKTNTIMINASKKDPKADSIDAMVTWTNAQGK
jgi:hypothetical protein